MTQPRTLTGLWLDEDFQIRPPSSSHRFLCVTSLAGFEAEVHRDLDGEKRAIETHEIDELSSMKKIRKFHTRSHGRVSRYINTL